MEEAISKFMDGREAQEHCGFKTCTNFLVACLCLLQGKSSNQAHRCIGRLFSPIHEQGRAEAIYTILIPLVPACPGIQLYIYRSTIMICTFTECTWYFIVQSSIQKMYKYIQRLYKYIQCTYQECLNSNYNLFTH